MGKAKADKDEALEEGIKKEEEKDKIPQVPTMAKLSVEDDAQGSAFDPES